MDIRVSLVGQQKQLQRMLKLMPGEMQKITKKVINEVVDETHRELGGIIPRAEGVSIGGYRRVRSKKRRAKGRKRVRASIWQGTLRIPAKYAGKPRNVKGGAQAGRHFFPGAFVATMKDTGYTGIFRRRGADKHPLEQEYVYLDNAPGIVQSAAQSAETKMRQRIRQLAEESLKRMGR